MYVWFVVFTRSKWKMSAGRCVLLMSNHNGPGDFSEFWCSEDCKALVFYPPNRNTFFSHISLCSLTMDRPFQRGRMELVFVCLCLSCDINGVPYSQELRCDPSARPLGSNLLLGCLGLRWGPDCEKFSVTSVVPGPFKPLLVLISFPFADWCPACCSSPCWRCSPGLVGAPAGPRVWLRWHWLGPHVQVGWFWFEYWWCSGGKEGKAPFLVCLLYDTLGANSMGCPQNWLGALREFEEPEPPAVTALGRGEERDPRAGTNSWAGLYCHAAQNNVLGELHCPERAGLGTPCWRLGETRGI